MFNKKRMVVFTVFILFMFLFITFAGGTPQNQAIATRIVKFIDGYNNEVISEQRVLVGEDAEVPNDPKHNAMVFAGWYLEEDRDVRVTDFSNVIDNVTVIALYGADRNGNGIIDDDDTYYTVRFVDSFDNSVISTQEVLVGMNAESPLAPVHAGMTFVGWSRGFTNVQSNITVNSVMRANDQLAEVTRYNVTFVDGDTDEVISVVSVEEGLTAPTPEVPKHKNRVFVRWDGNYTNVNADGTVTAVYADDINNNGIADVNEQRFGVAYYSSLNGEVVLGGSYLSGTSYTVRENVFSREKQVFIGWSTTPVAEVVKTEADLKDLVLVQPNTEVVMADEAVRYYAVWAENKNEDYENENNIDPTPDYKEDRYTLSVDYVDGKGNQYVNATSYKVENLLVGEKVSIDTPVNKNYKFVVDAGLLNDVKQSTSKVSGTMPESDVIVKITYEAMTDNNNNGIDDNEEAHYTLTINYVNNKGDKVFESVVKSLVEGEAYSVKSTMKENYTVDKEIVEGTMEAKDVEVTVTYTPDKDNNNNGVDDREEAHYTLTINYVNNKGDKVFEPVVKSLVEGEAYSIKSTMKENYTVDKEIVEGTMEAKDVEVTVTYTPEEDNNNNGVDDREEAHYTLTINYVNNKGAKVFEPVVKSLVEGEAYSIKSTMKENYTVDKEIVEGTMEAKDVEVTVTYTPEKDNNNNGVDDREEAHYTLTINYVNNKGDKVFEPVVKSLVEGEAYSIKSTMKENYTVDKEIVEGTMEAKDVEVTVTYTPEEDNNNNGVDDREEAHYTLTINYVNNKGAKVFEPVVKSLVEGEAYSVKSTMKENYTVDKEIVEGTMEAKDVEITVTYTPEKDNNNNGVDDREEAHYTLTINYVNNKGAKVFEPVVKSLVEGEAYSIKSTMKENYTVDKEVVEGTMEATDVEVTVTYTANRDKNDDGIADQDQKLKVQFIDWDGTILDTQYVMYDDNAVAPQDPTRSNTQEWKYTFSGWLQDYEHVTSDLEVYADYTQEKQQYTVTFLDYYGSEINKVTVDYGTTTVVAPNVPAEIKVGSDNVVSFKEWDTEDYKNVVKNTTVRAKYIMVKASRASLFELKNDYIRQIKGGADDSSRFTDNNVTIAIKDDETGKLADIMSNWTKNSGELKLAVGKNEIRKYLTAEGLNVVDSNNYDIYVLKYNGTKWHLDYQKNDNDVAVYRYNQQGNASAVSKQLKVISESHIITSIDRYADNKLVETVNVHSQGNGTYISDSFNVADINQTGSYTTGLWPFKEYHECYYIVHYDNGGTQKVYWTK